MVTGQKEEKKEKKMEEKKFLQEDTPIKSSTRGPRGPKNMQRTRNANQIYYFPLVFILC